MQFSLYKWKDAIAACASSMNCSKGKPSRNPRLYIRTEGGLSKITTEVHFSNDCLPHFHEPIYAALSSSLMQMFSRSAHIHRVYRPYAISDVLSGYLSIIFAWYNGIIIPMKKLYCSLRTCKDTVDVCRGHANASKAMNIERKWLHIVCYKIEQDIELVIRSFKGKIYSFQNPIIHGYFKFYGWKT